MIERMRQRGARLVMSPQIPPRRGARPEEAASSPGPADPGTVGRA